MVEVSNKSGVSFPLSFLQKAAEKIIAKEAPGKALSLVLISETEMRRVSLLYKGVDHAANVLSFPESEFGLGEVALCPVVIRKEAGKYGITMKRAMLWMLIHGILHLAGYTHETGKRKEAYYLSFCTL